MAFYYSNGSLGFNNAYRQPNNNITLSAQQSQRVTDAIRPMSLYVESSNKIDPGHVVNWNGQAAMFKTDGSKVNEFTSQHGHEFALSQIEPSNSNSISVAGIVLENAAEPSEHIYTQRCSLSTCH